MWFNTNMPELKTIFPIYVYARPKGPPQVDWREVDEGPGIIVLPPGEEIGVRARMLNDADFEVLVEELKGVDNLTMLNLAENRGISDEGLELLKNFPLLRTLNLSSVSLTNTGMACLKPLIHLTHLDLSFCNRITDVGVKTLRGLSNLQWLKLQGCPKVSNAGAARIKRRGLEIHT
jgi:hypothetical protein